MTRSIEECIEMIEMYHKAEKAVLTGRRYRIGTRELERADLQEIRKGRIFWENELERLERRGKRPVSRRVIPRDL
ncbi:MAG TPA: DUF6148 family protein [Fusobacterium sp.]|uniref:DUF6148 family protein n=1 Tax=Fusobacterium sp. TaxID=68766 RepID=UPI002F40FAA1